MIKLFLLLSLTAFGQWKWYSASPGLMGHATCCGGARGNSNNTNPGKPASGFGSGGGSSGWGGGSGGDAYYIGGGGGGGVGCYPAGNLLGGVGGAGAVVLTYYQGLNNLGTIIYAAGTGNVTIPLAVDSIKFWAVGGGGAGGTCDTNDATSSNGGGAGAVASRTITGTGGKVLNISVGVSGAPLLTVGSGGNGGATTVIYDPTGVNQTTTAGGGVGGSYNNTGAGGNGGACSGTYDVCLLGGSTGRVSGDTNGTAGSALGASGGSDGSNDDGTPGQNAVDTNGLFAAVSAARQTYFYTNAGISDITMTPKAAYSFRRLIASYTGPLFRVRRSSDNTEMDIGLNGEDSDIGALKAFVGTASGYVTTWYNQVGPPHAVQTVAANQPRIVNAGAIDLSSNGNILMMYFSSNQWFDTQIGAQTMTKAGNEGTTLVVARPFGDNTNSWSWGVANDAASNRWMSHFTYQGGQPYNNGNIYFDVGNLNTQRCVDNTQTPYDTWRVWTFLKESDKSRVWRGTTLGCTSQIATGQRYTGNETFYLGSINGPTALAGKYNGFMAEWVQYADAVNTTELTLYQQKATTYFGLRY